MSGPKQGVVPNLFAALFGAFLGLCLLKFSGVPIMERFITAPKGVLEVVIDTPWPIAWAYAALGLVTLVGLFAARWPATIPRWLVLLPLVWLGWQWLAAAHSCEAALSRPTLYHFCACVVCFYLGLFALSGARQPALFWAGLATAFLIVLAVGWQ